MDLSQRGVLLCKSALWMTELHNEGFDVTLNTPVPYLCQCEQGMCCLGGTLFWLYLDFAVLTFALLLFTVDVACSF